VRNSATTPVTLLDACDWWREPAAAEGATGAIDLSEEHHCERLIGSLRRECLDWFIPLNERHVRMLAREWAVHYNQARPDRSLGPGIPDPPPGPPVAEQIRRHAVSDGFSIKKKSILGGLHHEYRLERMVA